MKIFKGNLLAFHSGEWKREVCIIETSFLDLSQSSRGVKAAHPKKDKIAHPEEEESIQKKQRPAVQKQETRG